MSFDAATGELVEVAQFFAPAPSDMVDGLIGRYRKLREQVERVSTLLDPTSELGGVVPFFVNGNQRKDAYHVAIDRLFQADGAIAALNSSFWSQALSLTDVYNCMPQKRRDEWNNSIHEHKTPEFTEDNVRATLGDLLAARGKFFAERVDGIFQALSRSHVTNTPEGFNRRMILEYVFNDWGSPQSSKTGTINDLRCVIAKFMGRDEPRWNVSSSDLRACRNNPGQWHVLDGGALRVRAYLKGTAHLEVHPDMAWRLNAVLHTLHPHAIPSNQRTKPPRAFKAFAMMSRPLPFAVLQIIRDAREAYGDKTAINWGYESKENKPAFAEAVRVLEMIGGVANDAGVKFEFEPREVIDEIVMSGCVPDRVSHQFYPTPDTIARAAVDMAQIGELHTCLEPSAGTGHLADLMPKDRTACVEISGLHCKVLEAKGCAVTRADFLEWAKTAPRYDRIVMNPPFSEGRAVEHVRTAFGLLSPGGRLVAVLPASMRGKPVGGCNGEWSQAYSNEFDGTSVAVAIVAMDKANP